MLLTVKKRVFVILLALPMLAWAKSPLNLYNAEQVALHQSPELQQLQTKIDALNQDAISAKQWDDPKLIVGSSNLPTDSFSFTQDSMTQIQLGLSQQFPKGHSLAIHSLQYKLKAKAINSKKDLMKLTILLEIRASWLEMHYWQQALVVYKNEQQLFEHLQDVNIKHLANNQLQQKDVVMVQLKLSQLKQKTLYAKQRQGEIKGDLARWLPTKINQLSFQLPNWPLPPSVNKLKKQIKQHPVYLADIQNSKVKQTNIQLAEQQYIPGVNMGVVYGIRQGHDSMNRQRSNFVGVQVALNLPIFTSNRQSKTLEASEDRYSSAMQKELSDSRLLQSQLLNNYASWQNLSKQEKNYTNHLLPEAKHYAEATKIAYQNKQTDFATLVNAYMISYNTELAALQVQVDVLQARGDLLYLQGR
jgi:outer membrane protein TolC